MSIERSAGFPLGVGAVAYGMAGGGWSGVTAELDDVVLQAAETLAAAYCKDIEFRFKSDRHSGGAWLRTPDGRNNDLGIGASVITAWTRQRWESRARRHEAEAAGKFGLNDQQRAGAAEEAAMVRRSLADFPEGLLTVYAHIRGHAVRDHREAAALAQMEGWYDMGTTDYKGGYHHGDAGSVGDALTRCLRFVPPEQAR